MKKLLIMTGVAAFALGAFAAIELPNGTGFDGATPYDSYWVVPSDVEAAATPYESGEALEVRPAYFSGDNVNYLGIESASTTSPLTRYIGTLQDQESEAIGNGLYLDTLVQFTVSTETMGASEGSNAKLAIWAQTSDETPAVTNFVVQAGYITAGDVEAHNYAMTAPADFDYTAWHRLTVKAIANIDANATTESTHVVGFVVFVDGTALTRANSAAIGDEGYVPTLNTVAGKFAAAVLPSMIHTGNTKTTLQAVSFSGNGKIDDVSFTDVAPEFAADATVYTVTWGEGIAGVSCGGTAIVKGDENTLPTGSFDLVVTLDSGYALRTPVASGCTVTANGNTFTVSGATPGASIEFTAFLPKASVVVGSDTTYYDSLTDAFDAAKTTGGTITLSDTAVLTKALSLQSEKEVTIDLNGQTITGAAGQPVFTIEAGSLIVTNSVAAVGAVTAGTEGQVLVMGGGLTKIYGGKFTGGFEADGAELIESLELYGGLYKDELTWATKEDLEEVAKADVTGPDENGYYTVGGETPPEPTTFTVTFSYTVPGAESATESSVDVEDGTLLSTLTWPTLPSVSGYTAAWPTYAEGASVTEDVTYTATYSANTYKVTFYTNTVEYATATYTYGDANTYAAPADPVVEGFDFGGWFTDDGTFKMEFVFSANVAADTQAYAKLTAKQTPEDDYPSYIPTEDTAAKAKYDSWATYAGVTTAAAAEELEAAYLLNCKPDEVAAAKAAFKFTSITKEGDKWVTPTTTSYNDREYNGTVTVKRYSDVECKTESETGTFFRATLQ